MSRVRYVHLALAAGLLALLLWTTDIGRVAHALTTVRPLTGAVVIALNVPIGLLYGLRSHLVLRRLGHRIPTRILLPVALLGNVAGSLTPASAGEMLRTAVLKSHADVGAKDGFALVLYERALSVYLTALGTGVVAALVALPGRFAVPLALMAMPLLALPFVGSVLLDLLPSGRMRTGPAFVAGVMERAKNVADRLQWLLHDRALLLVWSTITFAVFAIMTLQFWLLAHAMSDVLSPQKVWVAFGASSLAGTASLLPLGLGASDGSLAALLRRAGMTLEQGTAVAVLSRATITLPLGLAAVGCYLYLQRLAPREVGAVDVGTVST